MERLEAMKLFVSVNETGSLSAASRKLRIPIATVSRNLSELEAHLGVKLLIRSTRKLELTDAGRTYLTSCKRIIEEVEEAEKVAKGEFSAPKGHLTITAPLVFGRLHMVPLVADFLKSYPDITIQLILSDQTMDLIEGHIDLAVRIGELQDSSLIATRVGVTRKITCAGPGYLAANGTPKQLEQLKNHHCISIESVGSPLSWRYVRGEEKVSVAVKPRLIVSSVEAGIDAAVAGAGITRAFCYQIQSQLKADKLQLILKNFVPTPSPINMLYPSSRVIPEKLRAFMKFAVPKLKDKLSQT